MVRPRGTVCNGITLPCFSILIKAERQADADIGLLFRMIGNETIIDFPQELRHSLLLRDKMTTILVSL